MLLWIVLFVVIVADVALAVALRCKNDELANVRNDSRRMRDLAMEYENRATVAEMRLESRKNAMQKHAEALGLKVVPVICLVIALCGGLATAQEVSPAPEDGGRSYLCIITHANPQPHELQLLEQLATDPNLVAIRNQCHFSHLTETDPLYKERYSKRIPPNTLPCIWLARADGGVLYKATGERIPAGATELFDEMAYYASLDPINSLTDSSQIRPKTASNDCPDGRCPLQPSRPAQPTVLPWLNDPAEPSQILPDTAELLRDRAPVKNSLAAILWIAGGLGLLFVFAVGGVLFLAVVYVVAKVLR